MTFSETQRRLLLLGLTANPRQKIVPRLLAKDSPLGLFNLPAVAPPAPLWVLPVCRRFHERHFRHPFGTGYQFHRVGRAQFQRPLGTVHDVAGHVALRAAAKVPPTAPRNFDNPTRGRPAARQACRNSLNSSALERSKFLLFFSCQPRV